jgi:hypothetical protein
VNFSHLDGQPRQLGETGVDALARKLISSNGRS